MAQQNTQVGEKKRFRDIYKVIYFIKHTHTHFFNTYIHVYDEKKLFLKDTHRKLMLANLMGFVGFLGGVMCLLKFVFYTE